MAQTYSYDMICSGLKFSSTPFQRPGLFGILQTPISDHSADTVEILINHNNKQFCRYQYQP
jgi:hypothetical protein